MSPTLTRLAPRILPPLRRTLSTTPLRSSDNKPNSPSWSGRQPSEHVTNRNDELDVQSGASKSGARQRVEDDQHEGSSATSQKDPGNQNEKAKRDHPEAPGPVIGMNDERGGVSYYFPFFTHGFVQERSANVWDCRRDIRIRCKLIRNNKGDDTYNWCRSHRGRLEGS